MWVTGKMLREFRGCNGEERMAAPQAWGSVGEEEVLLSSKGKAVMLTLAN